VPEGSTLVAPQAFPSIANKRLISQQYKNTPFCDPQSAGLLCRTSHPRERNQISPPCPIVLTYPPRIRLTGNSLPPIAG
jgi:hypothetical protein